MLKLKLPQTGLQVVHLAAFTDAKHYEVRACSENKISRRSSLDFSFSLFLLPSFFAFVASFFFSLAGNLVGFIFVGGVFRKAFRILGLGERKGRWAME